MEGHTSLAVTAATANRTDIGGGVFVPETSLRYIDHTKFQSLTTGLLNLLFSREELRQCSVTGKRCNIHKKGPKKMLEARKLEALVGEMSFSLSVIEIQCGPRLSSLKGRVCGLNSSLLNLYLVDKVISS